MNIIIIIMMVPSAVGVLVLGLDSPISPVVMTARLQEPAMLSSAHYHYTQDGGGNILSAWNYLYKIPLFKAFTSLGKKYNLSWYIWGEPNTTPWGDISEGNMIFLFFQQDLR